MSTIEISHHFEINQSTARKFKKKIQLAISAGNSSKTTGLIEVDEFIVGGKEKRYRSVA